MTSAGLSVAFSEATFDGIGSPRGVGSSQRATRDLGEANIVSEIDQPPLHSKSSEFAGTSGSGSMRTSSDFKMLIAKADAMLGQFTDCSLHP